MIATVRIRIADGVTGLISDECPYADVQYAIKLDRMTPLAILRQLQSWLYARYIAPARLEKRRSQRLAVHQVCDLQSISTARLTLDHNEPNSPLSCSAFVIKYASHYQGKQQAFNAFEAADDKLQPLLTAIDLRQYATHQDYVKAIRKQSGYFLRNANKAKGEGFKVRTFVEVEHVADMFEIIGTKQTKLLHLNQSTQTPLSETYGLSEEHCCSQHWERLFGVFSDDAHPKLVAYARLRRFGNIVACQDFIGHQSHLNSGVMKLLLSEVMCWLIDSDDSARAGVDFLGFGTLEFANDGLFFWKKKALFTPWVVALQAPQLPEGWRADRYLEINQDVAQAGADPVAHYLTHGKFENRSY